MGVIGVYRAVVCETVSRHDRNEGVARSDQDHAQLCSLWKV